MVEAVYRSSVALRAPAANQPFPGHSSFTEQEIQEMRKNLMNALQAQINQDNQSKQESDKRDKKIENN